MIYLDDVRDRRHGSYQMDNNPPRRHCRGKGETNSATLILSQQSNHGSILSAKQKEFWSRVSPTKSFKYSATGNPGKPAAYFFPFLSPAFKRSSKLSSFFLTFFGFTGAADEVAAFFLPSGSLGSKSFSCTGKQDKGSVPAGCFAITCWYIRAGLELDMNV